MYDNCQICSRHQANHITTTPPRRRARGRAAAAAPAAEESSDSEPEQQQQPRQPGTTLFIQTMGGRSSRNKATIAVVWFLATACGLYSISMSGFGGLSSTPATALSNASLSLGAGKPSPLHKIMVAPFSAYKVDEAGDTKHRSCKKTIIVHGKEGGTMKWSDQPFDELVMSDIPSDSELNDDMLCLQVGSYVAALVSGTHTNSSVQDEAAASVVIIGSDETDDIVHQLKRDMFEGGSVSVGIEVKIVERKSIAIHEWYQPSTHAVRLARSTDQNSGNFIWKFGATRLINPYTTKFLNPSDARKESVDVDALVLASANALHLADPERWKDYVNGLSSLVKEIDRPTIMLGIGIQAKFSDIKDTKHIALHEHQAHLMNEIAKRNTLEKSVSVRGEFTETACINAGVHNCLSMGCPR